MTKTIAKLTKSKEYSTVVRRCHWCGKPIFTKTIQPTAEEEFTLLCGGCLEWERKDGVILYRVKGEIYRR